MKQPINFESLSLIKTQKPKILHISCHGDFDHSKKEFYLQFEDESRKGLVDKFTQSRLKDLLGETQDHGI